MIHLDLIKCYKFKTYTKSEDNTAEEELIIEYHDWK